MSTTQKKPYRNLLSRKSIPGRTSQYTFLPSDDENNIMSLQQQVEAAQRALETAQRDLLNARQSMDRLMTNKAAADSTLCEKVDQTKVTAYYDAATASVVFIGGDDITKKPKEVDSPRNHSHETVSTADNTSCGAGFPSSPGIFRLDTDEEIDEDPGYLDFLAYLNSSGTPPAKSNANQKKKAIVYVEDIELSQKEINARKLRSVCDLFNIPEEASIRAPSEVSSIADASTSNRNDSFPPSTCNKVIVHRCTPDAIHAIEGVYHKFETRDGVNCYAKIGSYEGQETMFSIGRWKVNNGLKKWYITGIRQERKFMGKTLNKKLAFYYAYSNDDLPPADGWMECVEGKETFLWPAYIAKGCSRVKCFEYSSPITIEREWRRSSRGSFGSMKKFNSAMTL
jgi:hypothetical protein